MQKIKVIHDAVGHSLTVWLDDPSKEAICEETADEVILMKDADGKIIGLELLHYQPPDPDPALASEILRF